MSSTSAKRHNHKQGSKTLPIIGMAALAVLVIGGIWLGSGLVGGLKPEVSAAEAAALRDQGALFLDVRSEDEWNTAHVPGSTLIPLDQLKQRLSEVPPDRTIVVICASGARSRTGRDMLIDAGFKNITCMTGGLREWQAEGYQTVTGP